MNWDVDWGAIGTSVQTFFTVKKPFDFWEFINAPFFVTVILGLLGLLLQRRIRRDLETAPQVQKTIQVSLEKTAATQGQIADLIAASPEAGANVVDLRLQAKENVQRLKDKINAIVARDTDQRHHRVYERLGRTDYKLLVQALFERGQIQFETAAALNVAFASWDAYAKGRAARKAVPQGVIDLLSAAETALGEDD